LKSQVFGDNNAFNNDLTVTHIQVYNSKQSTGKIALRNKVNHKNKIGYWEFNELRNIAQNLNTDIYDKNYTINESNLNYNLSWFKKDFLIDTYFIVRLYYNNTDQKKIIISDLNISTNKLEN